MNSLTPTGIMLPRMLLGATGSNAHGEDAPPDSVAAGESPELVYTLDLRIAAIFVIFAAALALGLPVMLMRRFNDPDSRWACLMRSFAAGSILSLATIHVIPDAYEDLNGLTSYNIGGITVLVGVFMLVIIDSSLQALWLSKPASSAAAGVSGYDDYLNTPKDACSLNAEEGAAAAPAAASTMPISHGHVCLRSVATDTFVAAASNPAQRLRHYITAYTMELGCIFHSIIIGVGIGVITNSRLDVVIMLVALSFHQALEGMALGSVLGRANFPRYKQLLMMVLYAITTPVGVAIGIAVAQSYDPESRTAKAVQGSMNGVSGGMLLYISIYQLIAEEFSKTQLLTQTGLRLGMYAALIAGGASMAVLAIWA